MTNNYKSAISQCCTIWLVTVSVLSLSTETLLGGVKYDASLSIDGCEGDICDVCEDCPITVTVDPPDPVIDDEQHCCVYENRANCQNLAPCSSGGWNLWLCLASPCGMAEGPCEYDTGSLVFVENADCNDSVPLSGNDWSEFCTTGDTVGCNDEWLLSICGNSRRSFFILAVGEVRFHQLLEFRLDGVGLTCMVPIAGRMRLVTAVAIGVAQVFSFTSKLGFGRSKWIANHLLILHVNVRMFMLGLGRKHLTAQFGGPSCQLSRLARNTTASNWTLNARTLWLLPDVISTAYLITVGFQLRMLNK